MKQGIADIHSLVNEILAFVRGPGQGRDIGEALLYTKAPPFLPF